MKGAHVVALCTGSLRLLHQLRSPAARLVSSQVGAKGDDVRIQNLVSRPGYLTVRRLASQAKEAIKAQLARRSPLCALATNTCWLRAVSQPEEKEESTEDTSPITRNHVMSLFIAVKWCRRRGNYGHNPCVHDVYTTTIHEMLKLCPSLVTTTVNAARTNAVHGSWRSRDVKGAKPVMKKWRPPKKEPK